MLSRREMLKQAGMAPLALAGLRALSCKGVAKAAQTQPAASAGEGAGPGAGAAAGLGPLKTDPHGVLALPEGFTYRIVARAGQTMDDGLLVPGMAAFESSDGPAILVCNHENELGTNAVGNSPFGYRSERLSRFDKAWLYDPGQDPAHPAIGGTSTIIYDTAKRKKISQHLLAGRDRAQLRRRAHALGQLDHLRRDRRHAGRAVQARSRLQLRGAR
jgi:hypothetical protein